MNSSKENLQAIDEILQTLGSELFLNEQQIKLSVKTTAEGALSVFGKSPQLEFRTLQAKMFFDRGLVSGQVDVDPKSIEVTSGYISSDDQKKIIALVHEKIFETVKYPTITFDISGIATSFGPEVALLKGTLSFRNIKQRMAIPLSLTTQSCLKGSLALSQRDFGITPMVAMGGLIRVKDSIELNLEINLS